MPPQAQARRGRTPPSAVRTTMGHGLAADPIEQMSAIHIQDYPHRLTFVRHILARHLPGDFQIALLQNHQSRVAQRFYARHSHQQAGLPLLITFALLFLFRAYKLDVLRPDTHRYRLSSIACPSERRRKQDRYGLFIATQPKPCRAGRQTAVHEIHGWPAEKRRYLTRLRPIVHGQWSIHLQRDPVIHYHDAVSQDHCFYGIMSNIDHCRWKSSME